MPEKENTKNKNIKLSVAIPTYNGAHYIREALDSIISQLDDINEEIEIVVSDNASTDETQEVIEKYKIMHPELISYYRNNENVGFDRNVDLLFKRAKGEYVWMLSDDDALEEGSIAYLKSIFSKYDDLAIISVKCRYYDINLENILTGTGWEVKREIYCNNGDEYFQNIKFICGTMSSLIIKKELWNSINTEKFIGTGWIHFEVIINILLNRQSYIIGSRKMVKQRANCRWGKNGITSLFIGLNLVKIIKSMKNLGYKKETYSLGIKMMKSGNLMAIFRANKDGLGNKIMVMKKLIDYYKKYPSLWLIDLPMLFAPNIFPKIVYKIYKSKFLWNRDKR